MMKRVLLLVCLWLCLGLAGHAALSQRSITDNSGPIPKGGDTASVVGKDGLIVINMRATGGDETVDNVTVNIQNASIVASASVTIGSNSFDTTNFSDGVNFDIITGVNEVNIPSGDVVSFKFNLKLKDDASVVVGSVVTLNIFSIQGQDLDKTVTVNVSGFQGVTVNSVVSDSKILAGHENFPVLNVEVGSMVGEGLDSGLSVVVEKKSGDIINGVKLCFDLDKNNSIDSLSSCGTTVQFSGNQATPNLNKDNILNGADSTTNVLVVYDLSTSTPNGSVNYEAEVSTVLGTGAASNQAISDTAFNGSGNGDSLVLVGVRVNATADTPTDNVIPGNVTNDMLIIEVKPIGVTVNVAKLKIGNGEGENVGFQENQENAVKSIHIFDGTLLTSADSFTSSDEATVTLNKHIQPNNNTKFTIQYVLPAIDEGKIVQAVVKENSEFQVTVNGTAYIANGESGTDFKVFNLPISSEKRSVSGVDDKVVLRSVTPKTNNLVFVGQQSVPIFDLDISNDKNESVVAELTVKATVDPNGFSGFNAENQGIVGISVLNDSGNSVGFLSVSDSDSEQIIQFSVPKKSRETYTVGVNVGQDPDAVKRYTLSLDSIQSGIDVVKLEDIGKQTQFSVATYNLEASFDSFIDNVARITVTNNTGAPVTLNRVSLSAFEDGLGGNVVALRVTPSENVVIPAGNNSTILLSVDAVYNAEAMDVVFLPIIEATVSGNAVLLSRYRNEDDEFTSPFQTYTRGIRRSFSANTTVDPSTVHIDRIEVKNDDGVIGKFLNGDAVTPNSKFLIHMRNPSLWESVQLESVSAPHSGSDKAYKAEEGQLETRKFEGSGSFSLRVTPTDGSPFSIPIRFLMSKSLAVSDPLLYPNPYNTAGGSSLTLSINTTTPSDVEITLYDMRGRAVVAHNQSVPLGYTNVTIPGTGQLASGMYIAYVVIKSDEESVKKVVRLAVY